MDWSRFVGQNNAVSEQVRRELRTLQELRAYAQIYAHLIDAITQLRHHGQAITIDEGGRHIFVAGPMRTIGIHRDKTRHIVRVSGPGRFDPQEFAIPETEDGLDAWSLSVVKAAVEILMA